MTYRLAIKLFHTKYRSKGSLKYDSAKVRQFFLMTKMQYLSVSHNNKYGEHVQVLCCKQLPFINLRLNLNNGSFFLLFAAVHHAISEEAFTDKVATPITIIIFSDNTSSISLVTCQFQYLFHSQQGTLWPEFTNEVC